MCNVCCADAAIAATAAGAPYRFTWNPGQPDGMINNWNAPPMLDQASPEWPALYVEATADAEREARADSEGPGRVRASYDAVTWTAWVETTDVAGLMSALGVDYSLASMRPVARDAILVGDVIAAERAMRQASANDKEWAAGYAAGELAGRKRTIRTFRDAVQTVILRISGGPDAAPVSGVWLRGFAVGMRERPLRRARRKGSVTVKHTGEVNAEGGAILEVVPPGKK
jgi:hypothetical protein